MQDFDIQYLSKIRVARATVKAIYDCKKMFFAISVVFIAIKRRLKICQVTYFLEYIGIHKL